ncbi:MAG: hypothetical protein IGS48_14060 [Oscillatoriales cyanobacterium C42_A2020_001]|nr:hypothetical protein [Leptolyngbyaceae cyanobacterium C42_A2020_001]
MANCPFCSDVLLRHIRAGQAYWLCRRCRTEILDKNFEQAVFLKNRQKAVSDSAVPALGQSQLTMKFDDLAIQISPKS